MPMTNYQTNAYKETKVKTASPGKIIVMLYDEAIKQLSIAIDLIDEKNKQLDRVNNAILKARDIITELMVSLDLEQGGDFAIQMFSLYQWFNDRLMEGNLKKDNAPLNQVRDMMTDIRGAWAQIAGKTNVDRDGDSPGVNIAG
jgi:flagellar protein FliS